VLKAELKRELEKKHLREVIQYLSAGDNDERYSKAYAKRKNKESKNVRRLGGAKSYSQSGPVDFSFSGDLLNAMRQRATVKRDSVVSTIFVGPGQHRGGLSYSALVDQLDKEKNLRRHALDAVKENKATLIDATVKKSIARTNSRLAGQSLRRANSFF